MPSSPKKITGSGKGTTSAAIRCPACAWTTPLAYTQRMFAVDTGPPKLKMWLRLRDERGRFKYVLMTDAQLSEEQHQEAQAFEREYRRDMTRRLRAWLENYALDE